MCGSRDLLQRVRNPSEFKKTFVLKTGLKKKKRRMSEEKKLLKCILCEKLFDPETHMDILRRHLYYEHNLDPGGENRISFLIYQHYNFELGFVAKCKYCPKTIKYINASDVLRDHLEKSHQEPNLLTTKDGWKILHEKYHLKCDRCAEIVDYLRNMHFLREHLETEHLEKLAIPREGCSSSRTTSASDIELGRAAVESEEESSDS